jgi:hypothetical protein
MAFKLNLSDLLILLHLLLKRDVPTITPFTLVISEGLLIIDVLFIHKLLNEETVCLGLLSKIKF